MLSCKDIVKIVSSEENSSWSKKIEVKMHLLMCRHCAKYAKQIDMIKKGFKKALSKSDIKNVDQKINEIENQVLEKIKK